MIISTGAGAVYFLILWGRLAGACVVVIESFARFEKPGSAGIRPLVTIQSHILAQQERFPEASGTLSWVLSAISISAKMIAAEEETAALVSRAEAPRRLIGRMLERVRERGSDHLYREYKVRCLRSSRGSCLYSPPPAAS